MSSLSIVAISATCILPSLGYNYKVYKEKRSSRLEFALINIIAVLIVFTLFLASQLPR